MSTLRRFCRGLFGRAMLGAAMLHLGLATAWAQENMAPDLGPQKSYVNQYFLVGFCIALGLLVLCRPKSRSTTVEQETSLTS